MSLETLLEAAEFLESRGKELETKRSRPGLERRNPVASEQTTVKDETDSNETEEAIFKEPKEKSRTGKASPLYTGSTTEGFVMRAGTREVHNKLEKNRRAHLKECFDFLKKNIPSLEDKRTSNLGILRSSLRYIQNLKRKEREYELEMQRFAREKIILQEQMQSLKTDLNGMNIEVDLNVWTSPEEDDNETNSTSTATERGTPPPSDHDENDDDEEEAENLVMETNPSPTPKLKHKKGSKDHSSHKHSNHHKLSANTNGLVSRPHLSSVLKSPSKKTIPITLSLTGPVDQRQVPLGGPQSGSVTNPSGKLSEIPLSRLPVTQILHRTLTQRQALMKQSTISQVSSAPLTAAQLKSPPMTRPSAPVTDINLLLPAGVSKVVTTSSLQMLPSSLTTTQSLKLSTAGNVSMLNSVQSITGVTPSISVPLSLPYYMASMQKISHPILVTSLMAPALGLTTTPTTTTSSSASGSNINLATSVIPVKTLPNVSVKSESVSTSSANLASTVNYITTPVLSPATTQTATSTAISNTFPMRPIFAPSLIAGQVAWPFLTVPRANLLPTTSVSSSQISTSLQSSNTQATSVPMVSLTQLNQLTQMMAPVTVMSPSLQMTPSQLNTMIASPLLKQFQFPLGIPSSLLQPGQVLGQQVVKPVVVVTVPNIVSQSSTTVAVPGPVAVVTSSE